MDRRRIHRLMLYDLDPDAILCLCYNESKNTVAVLRNNRIELWNVEAAAFLQCTILLNTRHKLRAILWCNERLFAADLLGFVREYDVETLQEKGSQPVTSGACQCLAISRDNSYLAVGTGAKYMDIFEIIEDGIVFKKLIKCDNPVLSVCWDESGKHVAIGSRNKIMIFNMDTGLILHTLKLPKVQKKTNIIVWCVAFTKDFTLVSGDSSGTLSIWDGNTGTRINMFCDHKADILSFCFSKDQKTIYTTGVDAFLIQYMSYSDGEESTWLRSGKYRVHSHDVNSIICCGKNKICGGGVDGNFNVIVHVPFGFQRNPPLLQNPAVSISEKRHCVMLRYSKHLELWRLKKLPEESAITAYYKPEPPSNFLKVQSCEGELIRSSAMSEDLKYIAYSTNTRLRLFNVQWETVLPKLTPFSLPECTLKTVHHIRFSRNNKYLVVANSCNIIQVFSTDGFSLSYSIDLSNSKELFHDTIVHLVVSSNGEYIAIAGTKGQVAVWCQGQFYTTLPKYSKPVTAIAFHPFVRKSQLLYAVYSDYMFVEYSVDDKRFTDFTRSVDFHCIIPYLKIDSFAITNIAFDEIESDVFILHNSYTLCSINKDRVTKLQNNKRKKLDYELQENSFVEKVPKFFFHTTQPLAQIVRNKDISKQPGLKVFNRYEHLAYFGSFGKNAMVAVEVRPELLCKKMPSLLKRKRFGRA